MTRLLNLLAVGTLWFCLATPSLAAQAKVTWYGHAAFKVVTPGGKVMLVDPWISNPSNPTAKKDLENLRKVDLIFLTHGHADHIGDTAAIARQTGAKLVASFDLQKAMVAYKGFPENRLNSLPPAVLAVRSLCWTARSPCYLCRQYMAPAWTPRAARSTLAIPAVS